jgi:methylated-DNA-[protein]-cysteine S-methyltransferase
MPKTFCSSAKIVVFETNLGLMGTIETPEGVAAVRVGYRNELDLRRALELLQPDAEEADTSPLARRLKSYSAGKADRFDDVQLIDGVLTPFARRVTQACQAIPRGETISYAELAARAGSPNAYRAAGSVMAKNRWAIIVPCHRVVASGGGVGGYSVPEGLDYKRRLLKLERGGR